MHLCMLWCNGMGDGVTMTVTLIQSCSLQQLWTLKNMIFLFDLSLTESHTKKFFSSAPHICEYMYKMIRHVY